MRNATSTKDNWQSIITAVEARAAYFRAVHEIERKFPDFCIEQFEAHPLVGHARDLACEAAMLGVRPERVPLLLADIEILAIDYWAVVVDERRKQTDIDRLAMAEQGQWESLGFPSPKTLLAALLAHDDDATVVEGHSLSYDEDLIVTWYTNPYGIDGALCGVPTMEDMQLFLIDMAQGKDYGPVP